MSKTILLFEDDRDILDILYYLLKDAGYSVLQSTGSDAVNQALLYQPDLIILDHRLQVAWGADICRQLKTDPAAYPYALC